MKITIRSGIWLTAGEEKIIRRIALAVLGDDSQIQRREGNGSWSLHEGGNDWWATHLKAEFEADGTRVGVLDLQYRYAGGGNRAAFEALGVWLDWLFQ